MTNWMDEVVNVLCVIFQFLNGFGLKVLELSLKDCNDLFYSFNSLHDNEI